MAATSWDAFVTMRDMARDVETPGQAHAMVVTAGASAAHMALMIIERARIRTELLHEGDPFEMSELHAEYAIIDAAVEAWKTIYAFRGI